MQTVLLFNHYWQPAMPCLPCNAGLEQLLLMADYVVTSTHFPASWTGEQCLGDALLATLRCGRFPS